MIDARTNSGEKKGDGVLSGDAERGDGRELSGPKRRPMLPTWLLKAHIPTLPPFYIMPRTLAATTPTPVASPFRPPSPAPLPPPVAASGIPSPPLACSDLSFGFGYLYLRFRWVCSFFCVRMIRGFDAHGWFHLDTVSYLDPVGCSVNWFGSFPAINFRFNCWPLCGVGYIQTR